MTGIKQKFVILNLSSVQPSIKIADGTHSLVLGNGVPSISNKVTVNLNIFDPFMEYMILGNVDGRLITMHRHGPRLSEAKLYQ